MSLPTIEPLPDETESLSPARRRRQRRMPVPPGSGEKADLLRELALRTVPSFDFFLFSLLSGLALGAGLLLDTPAFIFLAALIAPFMAPAPGISLGTVTGSLRFILQSLASLGIGSLMVFLCGLMAGWAATLLPARAYQQVAFYNQFTWPGLLVLVLGAGLTVYLMVRTPGQRPLVSSVAIAYGLYLPLGASGFGLSSGASGLWPAGWAIFFVHLFAAALTGILVLGILGLRPLNALGYLLSAVYAVVGAAAVLLLVSAAQTPSTPVLSQAAGENKAETTLAAPPPATPSLTATLAPSPTQAPPTATVTPTRTLVPTRTPTLTLTPVPTPVWARISASEGDGALIREEPDYDSTVVQSALNGTLVEVLPDTIEAEGVQWVHIRLVNGKEGWIVFSLIRTATPAPSQ